MDNRAEGSSRENLLTIRPTLPSSSQSNAFRRQSMRYAKIFAMSLFLSLAVPAQMFAFSGSEDEADRSPTVSRKGETGGGFGVGVGFKTSTLGIGFDVATRLSSHANARVGFNTFSLSRNFRNHAIGYNGTLD